MEFGRALVDIIMACEEAVAYASRQAPHVGVDGFEVTFESAVEELSGPLIKLLVLGGSDTQSRIAIKTYITTKRGDVFIEENSTTLDDADVRRAIGVAMESSEDETTKLVEDYLAALYGSLDDGPVPDVPSPWIPSTWRSIVDRVVDAYAPLTSPWRRRDTARLFVSPYRQRWMPEFLDFLKMTWNGLLQSQHEA